MVENSPVSASKMKKEARTDATSTSISTVPIFMLVCFFMIMAMISVPPLDAPILNKIAVPMAGRKIANISSRSGSEVRGFVNGQIRSRRERLTDITTVA